MRLLYPNLNSVFSLLSKRTTATASEFATSAGEDDGEVGDVRHDVDDCHYGDGDVYGARHITVWVLHLLRHKVQEIPEMSIRIMLVVLIKIKSSVNIDLPSKINM